MISGRGAVQDSFDLQEFLIEVDQEPQSKVGRLQVRPELGLMCIREIIDRLELQDDLPCDQEVESMLPDLIPLEVDRYLTLPLERNTLQSELSRER